MEKQRELPKNGRKDRRNPNRPGIAEAHQALEAFDRSFRSGDHTILAGVDEAGRGALAGPVVAAAVILPPDSNVMGVRDSKTVGEAEREALFRDIVDNALAIGIACSSAKYIDKHNILVATLAAMSEAVRHLGMEPDIVIVDGRDAPAAPGRVIPVIGGDGSSLAIAAASILAKVSRDRMMRKLHDKHPAYNFMKNKGYGTQEHVAAITTHGMISMHRKSYRVKSIENNPQML